jgi:hypothetical protein
MVPCFASLAFEESVCGISYCQPIADTLFKVSSWRQRRGIAKASLSLIRDCRYVKMLKLSMIFDDIEEIFEPISFDEASFVRGFRPFLLKRSLFFSKLSSKYSS